MDTFMKSGSTIFLRGTVLLIGLFVLALCIFAVPAGISTDSIGAYKPILYGLYIPAIPFFFALYQAILLLNYIDAGKAFSPASVTALKYIKYCAILIGALFAAGMPYIYHVADLDDAPGVVLLGLVITFVSFVIAVFAAVLQKLMLSGLEIKAENDLTV